MYEFKILEQSSASTSSAGQANCADRIPHARHLQPVKTTKSGTCMCHWQSQPTPLHALMRACHKSNARTLTTCTADPHNMQDTLHNHLQLPSEVATLYHIRDYLQQSSSTCCTHHSSARKKVPQSHHHTRQRAATRTGTHKLGNTNYC